MRSGERRGESFDLIWPADFTSHQEGEEERPFLHADQRLETISSVIVFQFGTVNHMAIWIQSGGGSEGSQEIWAGFGSLHIAF